MFCSLGGILEILRPARPPVMGSLRSRFGCLVKTGYVTGITGKQRSGKTHVLQNVALCSIFIGTTLDEAPTVFVIASETNSAGV
jgi:hypothetical protein